MRLIRSFILVFLILAVVIQIPGSGIVDHTIPGIPGIQEIPITAADGDLSGYEITSFSETLADDVLFYPDVFPLDDDFADSGSTAGDGDEVTTNTYTATFEDDSTYYEVTDTTGTPPLTVYMYLTLTLPAGGLVEGFYYYLVAQTDSDSTAPVLQCKDDGASWDTIKTLTNSPSFQTYSGSVYDPQYWDASDLELRIVSVGQVFAPVIKWDYLYVTFSIMTQADADHYAESFADISDWAENSDEGSNTYTTDGDVMTVFMDDNGAGDGDYLYSNTISMTPSVGYYVEIRYKYAAACAKAMSLYGRTADFPAGSPVNLVFPITLAYTWTVVKNYIPAGSTFEGIYLYAYLNAGGDSTLYLDYMRFYPPDEGGFQFDGSTADTDRDDLAKGASATITSDGDKVTMTQSADTQTLIMYTIGSGSTGEALDTSLYPFLEWSITSITDGDADGNVWLLRIYNTDGTFSNVWPTDSGYSDDTGTFRANINILETSVKSVYLYLDDTLDSWTLDYVKAYNIAGWTWNTLSNCQAYDIAYVDTSNAFVWQDLGSNSWASITHDAALSVSTATYNVWNISIFNGASYLYVSEFGSNWVVNEERGDLVDMAGATLTDIHLGFNGVTRGSNYVISAIKFWTDATDPTIDQTFVNPQDPYDDEPISFTIAVTDWTTLEELILNPVTYPSGFTDQDYEASEQSTVGLWVYEFATMIAGYYLFSITADDGQGTDVSYIAVTVRESTIEIIPITLLGAGSDFDMITFSFEINKNCNYAINESSATVSETTTYSGSVIKGIQNIAWTKLTTDDTLVNFSIRFTNGSLAETIEGQYQVAQTTFKLEWAKDVESLNSIRILGYITKGATWEVYIDDSSTASYTGTIEEGDFSIKFAIMATPGEVDYAVKFLNASAVTWYNFSLHIYQKNIDSLDIGSGSAADLNADWRTKTIYWISIAVGFVILMVLIQLAGVTALLRKQFSMRS